MNRTNRPLNILWISIEDTSPRYGCYGDPIAQTPHLDRLAAEGRRYTNCFSTAPVCAPARCAVITGMYAASIGGHHMRTTHRNRATPELPTPYDIVPPPYVKCFTEYLRAADYFCTNGNKTDYQFTPPFTAWDELGEHHHWRHRPDPDQPFFSVFNPTMTHESGMWADKQIERVTDPDSVTLPPYLPDTPKARAALAQHYDNLHEADRRVGELLAQLEQDGLADNTIVVNWSDHGEGLPRAKRWPYDAGIHVPLIVRWPGAIEPGEVCHDLVSTIDLPRTMLSLAGAAVPAHLQGRIFLGPRLDEPRQYVYATRDRFDESYDMVRAVRDQRFKYIRNYYPNNPYLLWIPYRNRHPVMQEIWRLYAEGKLEGDQLAMFKSPRPAEELYDTEQDPFELNNLADDSAFSEDLKRMREALDAWRSDIGDMGDIPESEMVARWRPNGEQPRTAAPIFVALSAAHTGEQTTPEGGTFDGPTLVQLHCATQGASITWTTDAGDAPHWRLYTEPIRLEAGETTLRVKAVRIGYIDSKESVGSFNVT